MGNSVLLTIERAEEFYSDALAFFQEEWNETQVNASEIHIDYDYYLQLQAQNNLIIIAARDNQKLIGFIVLIGMQSVHVTEICAHSAAFFVHKDYRRKGIGSMLIERAKEIGKSGKFSIRIGTSPKNDISKLLEMSGGELEEKVYKFSPEI